MMPYCVVEKEWPSCCPDMDVFQGRNVVLFDSNDRKCVMLCLTKQDSKNMEVGSPLGFRIKLTKQTAAECHFWTKNLAFVFDRNSSAEFNNSRDEKNEIIQSKDAVKRIQDAICVKLVKRVKLYFVSET